MAHEQTPQPANVLAVASPRLARYMRGTQLLLPHGLTYKDWDDLGDWLKVAADEIERNASLLRCLRADWSGLYGTSVYGHTKAAQARSMFGVSALTIANDASELRRVSPDARQVPGVTFSQLAAVRHAEPGLQAEIILDAVANDVPASEVERRARNVNREEWRRGRLLAAMRNAYNDLDSTGREDFHKWYLKVRRLDG